MPYGYDKDTDYSKLMQEAIDSGDMVRAAIYEQQRNEKIAGEGLGYQSTAKYTNFLPGSEADKQGYVNPYQAQIDEAIAGLDPEAYKRFRLQEADRTMKDTLGTYSQMTGGIPSTAAVAAASQAADYEKSKLGAELIDLNAQRAGLLMNAGNQDANNYQMNINNALTRWTQLGYADSEVAGILGVPVGTSTADQAYTNWTQGQQGQQNAQSMIGALIQYGIKPTAEQIAASGLPEDLVWAMYYEKNPVQNSAGTTRLTELTGQTGNNGMDPRAYGELQSYVHELVRAGQYDTLDQLMSSYANNLSDLQATGLMNIIDATKKNNPYNP